MATLTVRPTSASGTSWQNAGRVYDGNTSQAATVSINSSNYSQRTLTVNFSNIGLPANATVTSATLYIIAKQSSSTSTRRITVQADINGNSSNRVINQQLTSTSNTTLSGNVADHISNLSSITITGVTSGSSYQSQTFSIYEVYIDIVYEVPVEYTITYRYLCDGQSIKTSTTEKVTSGTYKTFNINNAPLIDGYTVLSVSPTSATINSDTTVTFTYKKNVVGTTVDIYLPQPLGAGDRLYWNEAEGKYYIEHSTGIIQTEITQKIEFDNYANSITVQVDDSQVAPSSMTAWIAKKEVSSGGEPSEGEWITATMTDIGAGYYVSESIYLDDNLESIDISSAAMADLTGYDFYIDIYDSGSAEYDYDGYITLYVSETYDTVTMPEIYNEVYNAVRITIGMDHTNPHFEYRLNYKGSCGGGDSGGTDQEGDWVDADMRVGIWLSTTGFDPNPLAMDGLYHYTSEIIYFDGLKTIEVRGIVYDADFGLGVYLYAGYSDGSTDQCGMLVYEGPINVQDMISIYQSTYGVNLVAISIACYYLPDSDARLQYKLTR